MKKKYKVLLFFIVGLAFFLRFYKITQSPPSLNWDEASIGYNAYSILKTGRDEWGQFLPLHFKSYGEYKLPLQIYFSIPGVLIFGLNDFGVRITPVIYGTLTILFLFFLALEIFSENKNRYFIAISSAFFLAVSPWHIQLTRASFESSFSVFWIVLAIWFFAKGFKKHSWWIISMIPFSFATYTYNSARAFVPLFLFALIILYRKDLIKFKKYSFVSFLLFTALSIPILIFSFKGGISARYKLVSITDDAGLIPRIEERRNNSKLPKPVTDLIHNRYTYTAFYVGENYLAHFTPLFLFINGAGHKQHHVQGIGEMYWIQAVFVVFGVYYLVKNKEKYNKLIFSWLLISFIPVALTNDSIPHALRTLIAAPLYQIITACGVLALYKLLEDKRWLSASTFGALILLFLLQFVSFYKNIFYNYPKLYSKDWQYGYKEAVEFIKDNYEKYDLIVVTREYGEPHMFTLFYLNFPPNKYIYNPNLVRFETFDWVRVLKFDKFYFPDLGDGGTTLPDVEKDYQGKKLLFISTPDEVKGDINIIKTIDFLNGQPAFVISDNL